MAHNPGFLNAVDVAKNHVKEIRLEELENYLNSNSATFLVDVREDSEWEQGHIPKAIHIGKGVIERDIEQVIPDKNACIILYCGGGFRSALAADSIQKMGYTNVLSLAGGFREWVLKHG